MAGNVLTHAHATWTVNHALRRWGRGRRPSDGRKAASSEAMKARKGLAPADWVVAANIMRVYDAIDNYYW